MNLLHILPVLLLLSIVDFGQAAEPREKTPKLTAEERKEVDQHEKQMNRYLGAGRFEDAAKTAQQIYDFLAERQGANHWEVIDARYQAERSKRLTAVPVKDRTEVVRARESATLALKLFQRGQLAEWEVKQQESLDIYIKVLGEQHPETIGSYNDMAFCLFNRSKYAEALLLFQKALDISRKVFGEHRRETATAYNNMASCLDRQGKHAEAIPFYLKAVAIRLRVLGELHPDTAGVLNNLASCLDEQGKHDEAYPLIKKALQIRLQVLGEEHPDTARSYGHLACWLEREGTHTAETLALHKKALEVRIKTLGERHSETIIGYSNLASFLDTQRKYAEAFPLHEKAVNICLSVFGEQHPITSQCYNNLAGCLVFQDKYAKAMPFCQKAMDIGRKVWGDLHPDMAYCYANAAYCYYMQGEYSKAEEYWGKAVLGYEYGRLQSSSSGFDRSLFRSGYSPHIPLAACSVRLGQASRAWEHAESALARGLLDEVVQTGSARSVNDADNFVRLTTINQAILPLLNGQNLTAEEEKYRVALSKERDDVLTRLARDAIKRSRDRVVSLKIIQKQIPSDGAIVFWLDVLDQHLGCVLRSEGEPAWVKLPARNKQNWMDDDSSLPARTLAVLRDVTNDSANRRNLIDRLYRQRVEPLEAHLRGVRLLVVVPAGEMKSVPVEALIDRYVVSYVPSASVFARRMAEHRPLQASSALALADPVFTRAVAKLPAAPPLGLLVKVVTPGSLGARIGLVPGDVLLEYDGKSLTVPNDLKPSADDRVPIKIWRDGEAFKNRISGGELGVIVDPRAVGEALADWRRQRGELDSAIGGGPWQPLAGTRLEARALAAMVPETTLLLGSDANEQKLDELAASGKLKGYRLVHLATHGRANHVSAALTALILAQDNFPARANNSIPLFVKKPLDGTLTVGKVLQDWELDADLVVLSACDSGLGKETTGDGMLGFTQALMQKGARSVVLSRWKANDASTALLMTRFYENLIGKREGLKSSMKRAEALAEAKNWLRHLGRAEAQKCLAVLAEGVPRGERSSIKAALPTRSADAAEEQDLPFSHPYYWAAFVLLGDPD